jgi:hypothetical protein
MLIWIFLVGVLIYVLGTVLMHVHARRGTRQQFLSALRLRYLGVGLMLVLPGLWIAGTGVIGGLSPSRLAAGLLLIGFGALWLYARGGIGPNFPQA